MSEGSATSPAERAAAAMQLIGVRALTSNLRRVEELSEAIAGSSPEHPLSMPARESARGVAHQLAGSAGTFGFDQVSARARRLELRLDETSFPDAPDRKAALADLDLMRAELLAGPDEDLA